MTPVVPDPDALMVAEQARLLALHSYEVLDTPPEPGFDDITRLACAMFQVPMALMTLVDERRQWFKSRQGIEVTQTAREVSICNIAIQRPHEVLVVPDASVDARFMHNPLVTGGPRLRFYAGAPLISSDGQALGTLCIVDRQPHEFDASQQELLRLLSRQVMTQLELRRKDLGRARSLAQASARFDQLFQVVTEGVLLARPNGEVLTANKAACDIVGLSVQEICQRGRAGLIDTSDPRLVPLLEERQRTGRARGQLRMRHANGRLFEVDISSVIFDDPVMGKLSSIMFRDVSENLRLLGQLQDQVSLLNNLARQVPGAIYQFRAYPDGRTCFPYATEGIRDIYEVSPQDVREDASLAFSRGHPDDLPGVIESINVSAQTLEPWGYEYRVVLPRKGERWLRGDAQPERLGDGSTLWHGFISDITDRKQAEVQTMRLAYFDVLTGLPNRSLLYDRLEQSIAHAQRNGQHGGLMFLDLDRFKHVNDARGHATGDDLLRLVAQRLTGLLRAQDTVSRLGGDEFVLLIVELGTDEAAAAVVARSVADKVRAALDEPYEIKANAYTCPASIGITLFPQPGVTWEDLLRQADTAMYRAKATGRNRVAFFEPSMQHEVEQRLMLEQDLKGALAAGQLHVHVQGQVNAAGATVGAELLLRWQHPQLGSVSPAAFIPVAEETGLILPIGAWVIEQACQAVLQLQSRGLEITLSVNVSPLQFRSEDFVQSVKDVLQKTGAPACYLVLEVTEGLFIHDLESTLARMHELVQLGIRFSIDDFGTGYSSLAYLQRLPLLELKIDRGFVQNTPDNSNDTAIVSAILSMAGHLGLEVVAEGVEKREQCDFLLAHQCTRIQGYLFSRPQPIAPWLASLKGGH